MNKTAIGHDGYSAGGQEADMTIDRNAWVVEHEPDVKCPRCGTEIKMNLFDRRYTCGCGLEYYKPLSGLSELRSGWYDGQNKVKEAGGQT